MAQTPESDRTALTRAGEALVGAAVDVEQVVSGGISAVFALNRKLWNATEPLRAPLDAIGVTDLVAKPVEAVATRVETAVVRLEEQGRTALENSSGLVSQTMGLPISTVIAALMDNPDVTKLVINQVDKVLPYLAQLPAVDALVRAEVNKILPQLVNSPEIQTLIRAQAAEYITYLQQHPEVLDPLVATTGDAYIERLNQNPESVQNLVAGQSVSMAGEIMDEVRERTVTGDSAVEIIVRNILRRKPRETLPPPTETVQRRAEYGRLPSDFIQEPKNGKK